MRRAGSVLVLLAALLLAGCVQRPVEELATVYDTPAPASEPPVIMQEEHPAGCEVYCLQAALAAFGYEEGFDDVYALFDHSDSDFVTAWWGDPDTGGAAYPPAMMEAANRALAGTPRRATDITGCTAEGIKDALDGGGLVICWFTTDYAYPVWTGWWVGDWQMYANEHAIVVYDLSGDGVRAMDPLRGDVLMRTGTFIDIWTACGSMAVEIR